MRSIRPALALLALGAAPPAIAQSYDENPSGRAVYALADLRLTASEGERAWLDGGFGKTRFGGAQDGAWRVRPRLAEADLVWQPRFAWSLDATVAAVAQDGQEHPVDLSEAYLTYRHDPIGRVRVGARAGLMWPPVSLEHAGPAWSVTGTITPSAINSWIGEEVKVAAVEANATLAVAGGKLTGAVALFGFNDTAGTLLSFRGWALHDEKATAFGRQPLPPLDPFMQGAQAPATRPLIELDGRPGVYGKLGWATSAATLQAFYYDNRGDPAAVNAALQWGWRTRFAGVAARLTPVAPLVLTAQALAGTTQMGFPMPDRLWVDTHYRSVFVLATGRVGARAHVSGRVEAFGTRGRGSVLAAQTDEDGWAATLAGRRAIGDHLSVLGEVLHVSATRAERLRAGLAPAQEQTTIQTSVRLTY